MHFGKAFGDYIHRGSGSRRMRLFRPHSYQRPWRLFVLFTLVVVGFSLLEARLFHLTIVRGSRNRLISEANRTRERTIEAARGIIFDRNGIPLVQNIPVYMVLTESCRENGPCEQLTLDEVQRRQLSLSDPNLLMHIGRFYPFGSSLAHAIGYVAEVSREDLDRLNASCPDGSHCRVNPGSLVGRSAIEAFYDDRLRGVFGRELIEVDAQGQPARQLGRLEPKKGENSTLSLDSGLTQLASTLLASQSGAIIATNPMTGEILALTSSPSYDPNLFVRGDPSIVSLLHASNQPLFNRSVSGLYPPGSTFKIITAAAALEEGKITKTTEFEDTGVITIGPYTFPNWYFLQYGKTEGSIAIVRALARSNDIFFYKAAELVGIEKLSAWAKRFGMNQTLAIDLPGERAGVMPDPAWKERTFGESWFLGDTYHVAIGQGNVLTTPLGVNSWTNVIANGGKLCRPTMVNEQPFDGVYTERNRSAQDKQRAVRQLADKQRCKSIGLKKETIQLIKEGMTQACAPGGTGWPLFKFRIPFDSAQGKQNSKLRIDNVNFFESQESSRSAQPWIEIPIACKTGTAEYGDPKGKTHAWITAFAPIEDPQISVTVLVEGGGEGSSVAGPIAKKLFEYWFSR